MPTFRGKARRQGVLLLACCALFLRQCVSLRELHREHAAQRRVLTIDTAGGSSRRLQEAFEDDYDEDEELDSQPKLGTGISKLGIHGEGLGYVSHNLLESDSELIALAAAVKSGGAKATGRGAQSPGILDGEGDEAEGGEEDLEDAEIEDMEEAAQAAPDREQVVEAAGPGQEQVLQAAGLIDGEGKGAQAGEGASKEEEAVAEAKAKDERDRNSRPPWFAQRTLNADAPRKEVAGGRQKAGRRQRHHSTVEDTWLACHRQFVKELDEWDKQGGWDVLFYGDSIVEEWRGTFLGAPWGPFHDVRKVWDEYFGRKAYRAHSMGIASDGVEQLLWRIQHGEVPAQGQHHPKVVVVHVGTNDISGECSKETGEKVAEQMEKLLEEMHQRLPNTHIIVMAILPKGEVWPNRCSEAIDEANSRIADLCEGSPHLHYIDIGSAFLSETLEGNKFEIKETLMPDSMHPSAVGMRIIATRLEPLVSQLVASASRLPQTSR